MGGSIPVQRGSAWAQARATAERTVQPKGVKPGALRALLQELVAPEEQREVAWDE